MAKIGIDFTKKVGRSGGGVFSFRAPASGTYGQDWYFLADLVMKDPGGNGCRQIFDATRYLFKMYDGIQRVVNQIPGVTLRGTPFELRACFTMWAGIISHDDVRRDGRPQAGGVGELQVGAGVTIDIGWGFIRISAKAWLGLIIEVTLHIEGRSQDVLLQVTVEGRFHAHGKLGWIKGSLNYHLFTFRRDISWKWPQSSGAASQEPQDLLMVHEVTRPFLNALATDPDGSARLGAAIGHDPQSLPVGSQLNLLDPDVYEAFYGPENLSESPATSNQETVLGACPSSQSTSTESLAPWLNWSACALVDVTTGRTSVHANEAVGGVGILGTINDESVSATQECRKAVGNIYLACHTLGMPLGFASLFVERFKSAGISSANRVDYTRDSATVYVDVCAHVQEQNPVCAKGSAGMTPASYYTPLGIVTPVFTLIDTVSKEQWYWDQRLRPFLESVDPVWLGHDVACWQSGLLAPQSGACPA